MTDDQQYPAQTGGAQQPDRQMHRVRERWIEGERDSRALWWKVCAWKGRYESFLGGLFTSCFSPAPVAYDQEVPSQETRRLEANEMREKGTSGPVKS